MYTLYVFDVISAAQTGLVASSMVEYLVNQLAFDVIENNASLDFYDDCCLDSSEWQTFFKLDAQLTQKFMCLVISSKTENMLSENPALAEGCAWHEHSSAPGKPCERWPHRAEDFEEHR